MLSRDEQIDQFLTKGVSEVFPSKGWLAKELQSGRLLTVYLGFDPTAPSLHLGHVIQLRKLRQLQDLGHQVILLIGDFTATIGDPDKLSVRTPLTPRQVKANLSQYKKQASRYLRLSGKNAAKVKFNSKWLSTLKFADILSIAAHFTAGDLLKRDMFQRRIAEGRPVYLHEFLYPLMQGYDSVAMDVDGEIGGTDQTFNMLAGRDLMKQLKQKEKFVLTVKLLEDPTGKKMGKTEGNAVSLTDTPEDMYGKVMSWPDSVVATALELCTDLTMSEIASFLSTTSHPKVQKEKLAFEIVRLAYDADAANEAAASFAATFQKGEIPTEVPFCSAEGRTLEQLFIDQAVVSSRAELRRLVEDGAVSILERDEKVTIDQSKNAAASGTYKIGKSRFLRITE